MAKKGHITLGQRVRGFMTGAGYIPSLSKIGDESQLTVEEYTDKGSQLNANIGWVYTANQAISDDAGAVKLKLYKVKKNGDKEEVISHEALSLLRNPNNVLTSKQFFSLHHSYLNLTGESYILKLDRNGKPLLDKNKLPTALFTLPAHLCDFKLGKNSWDESTVRFNGVEYPIDAILRDINPDPENIYNGMSVVRKASLTIDTDIQMKRWNNKLFKNGARPGVVVEVPDRMSDDEYKRFSQEFDANYSGVGNTFRRLILEGGAKISPFMMSAQDLDFLESKKFTRDEILAMFRVGAGSIGIVDDVNRANAEAQEYMYAKRIIKPRMEQLVDFLNQRLIQPIYGESLELGFEEVVPEDRVQRLNESTQGVNKWLTINEVRETYGYEPLEGQQGNKLYVPLNSVPLEAISEITDITDGESNTETPDEDSTTPTDEGSEEAKSSNPKDEKRVVLGEAKVKAYTLRSLAYERAILRKSRAMFNAQKNDALTWLHNNIANDKSLVNLNKKDWADQMIDWEAYNKNFTRELQGILQIIVEEIGQEAYSALMAEGAFDPYSQSVRMYVNETGRMVAVGVNAETEKQIRATIAQGLRDNEGIQELSARVSSVFGTASTSRAYTIALTETALAQNTADVEAWKQTGVVEGKEWYTAEDEHTCLFCNEMDKKYRTLETSFFEKGETMYVDDKHKMNLNYRAIGEPPLHPSCRCVLLPVLA